MTYQPPLNPVQVESRIREIADGISDLVRECSDRYRDFLTADHAYDLAFARAYMAYQGPAHAKKYAAEIKTEQEREYRDTADVAYRYADRRARALQEELRAYQSVGASVRAMYSVAGRGEY